MTNLRGIWILPINQQYDVIITSNYVIVSIKLCLDVGNDECIILWSFCGCIMSGFEGIKEGGDFEAPPQSQEPKNWHYLRRTTDEYSAVERTI